MTPALKNAPTPEALGFSSLRLARIRPAMQAYVDSGKFAGISTLLARRGQIIHFEQVGVRDKVTQAPMAADTIFRVYSMTKPVVCTALMTLYEEGRFHLFDPVAKFLPAFANVKVWAGDGKPLADPVRPVLIRDLFTHTAGLTYNFLEDTPVSAMYQEADLGNAECPLQAIINELARLPLAYQPGSRWHYSMSIDVLGHLIEVISANPLQDFLQKRIFDPLGMTDSGFSLPDASHPRLASMYGHPDILTNRLTQIMDAAAAGLNLPVDVSKTYPTANTSTFARGGYGLYSTSMDYLRFAQMLLNRGQLNGERILGPKIVDLMHANHVPPELLPYSIAIIPFPGYGFGLGSRVLMNVADSALPGSPGEFGWSGAAATHYWVDPKEQLIGVLMTQFMISLDLVHKDFQLLAYQALIDS
jgi:CubicO group peptidase (beta-lactamase class C family)